MTDCVIRSRIDPLVKGKAIELFAHMGLTLSQAIRMFVYQAVSEKRITFSINTPNAVTKAALQEADQGIGLESTSIEQLRAEWKKVCVK